MYQVAKRRHGDDAYELIEGGLLLLPAAEVRRRLRADGWEVVIVRVPEVRE